MSILRRALSHTLSVLRPSLLIAVASVTPQLSSAQVFHSTGEGISAGAVDPYWQVRTTRYGVTSAFGSAYKWANPDWIANTPNGNNPPGFSSIILFDFRQLFDLTGYDASTATLSFQWACDDTPAGWGVNVPYFTLNGGPAQGQGTCGNYTYGNTVTLSGFQDGVNTLDFFVEGNGQTDGMELRTVGVEAVTAAPEPATLALVGTGLLGMIAMGRRRKREA